MKIAVTSQNFKTVTNHAGKARRFIIFDVASRDSITETARLDLPKEMSFHEFHGEQHPIDGVDVVISLSFGQGFAKRMKSRGITASLTTEKEILPAIISFLDHGQVLPSSSGEESHDHSHDEEGGCNCGCH